MYIIQIGELATRLTNGFKSRYSDIAWRDIIGMRNVFAHDYESINVKKVWETLQYDIGPLRERCGQIILEMEPGYDQAEDEDELLDDDGEDDWEPEE